MQTDIIPSCTLMLLEVEATCSFILKNLCTWKFLAKPFTIFGCLVWIFFSSVFSKEVFPCSLGWHEKQGVGLSYPFPSPSPISPHLLCPVQLCLNNYAYLHNQGQFCQSGSSLCHFSCATLPCIPPQWFLPFPECCKTGGKSKKSVLVAEVYNLSTCPVNSFQSWLP